MRLNRYPCPALFMRPDLPIVLQQEIKSKVKHCVQVIQFQDKNFEIPLSHQTKNTLQFYNPVLKDPVKLKEFETRLEFTSQKTFIDIVDGLFPRLDNDVDLVLFFEGRDEKLYKGFKLKEWDDSSIQHVIEEIVDKTFDDYDETIDFGDDEEWREAIDENTEKLIQEYRENINALNEYQQFLITIATKQILKEKADDLKDSYITQLTVKADYSIVLPYLNLEIKLNAC